ncbi:MAG: carboxypeptidase regulatory-like domain-containing protein [Fibrobacteria bacterium]|nr:carboxypeptidase regulatory-like domain-containing protein [Fibrobacteria bacterium]
MKKYYKINNIHLCYLVLLLHYMLFAQNFRGKIINRWNEPVAGATVTLVNPSQSTQTDDKGRFAFGTSSIGQQKSLSSEVFSCIPFQGSLKLELLSHQRVTLRLYSLQGKFIRQINNSISSPGQHLLSVFTRSDACGLYFIAGTIGLTPVRFRLLNTDRPLVSQKSFSSLTKQSASPYEIVCTKTGYNELRAGTSLDKGDLGELVMLKTGEETKAGIKLIKAYDTEITARIQRPSSGQLTLLELKPYQNYSPDSSYDTLWVETDTPLDHITFSRFDGEKDRMFNKFQLITGTAGLAVGPVHYVTELGLSTTRSFVLDRQSAKKGLANIYLPDWIEDAVTLGVKHTHYNISQGNVIDIRNTDPNHLNFNVDGNEIPIQSAEVALTDSHMVAYTQNGINSVLIILNSTREIGATVLLHPNTIIPEATIRLGAFNTTSDSGIMYFRSYIEFLAERYTRPDKKYGQISSMVIGNEVTTHGMWHNMGRPTAAEFIENYHRTLRIADLACRKYHKDLKIYISMECHWNSLFDNNAERALTGKELVETLNLLAKSGGDFPWNIGYHPYPENIFIPTYWENTKPTYKFDSPLITFKNLEVLPVYMRQENQLYKGKPRTIDITEVGFYTPTSADGQQIQAAAYVCSWYKTRFIPEISMYLYHRQVTHNSENIDLGLWSMDEKKKFIWDIFRTIDTVTWTDTSFSWAKPILNISSWDECLPDADRVQE